MLLSRLPLPQRLQAVVGVVVVVAEVAPGLRPEELPAEMRKMTIKERREHLDKVGENRAKLLREAAALDRQRGAYIAKELQKNKDSFDSQVLDLLRKQAQRRVRF